MNVYVICVLIQLFECKGTKIFVCESCYYGNFSLLIIFSSCPLQSYEPVWNSTTSDVASSWAEHKEKR